MWIKLQDNSYINVSNADQIIIKEKTVEGKQIVDSLKFVINGVTFSCTEHTCSADRIAEVGKAVKTFLSQNSF